MDFKIQELAQNLYGDGKAKTTETESSDGAPKVDTKDMGKAMEMFQDIMKSDPTMKQKADQLWKFLDDLYKNNPKEYNKFVTKHIEEGQEAMDQEKQKELEKKGIQSEPFLSWKIRIFEKLDMGGQAKDKQVDIKLFEFEADSELKSSEDLKTTEKYLAKPSIYLNLCTSLKVKAPLK